jgi:predicted ArsR family transcriptional regulator
MARTKRAASDTILALLKRGPQRGLTATDISSRTELNLNTTRTVLWALSQAGSVTVVSTDAPPIGRPANRYALAA